MKPELLIAISGLVTALLTGALAFYNASHAAKKDMIALLQQEITRLQGRVTTLEKEKAEKTTQYDELLARVFALEADNAALKIRIKALEDENARLIEENGLLQLKIQGLERGSSKPKVPRGKRRPEKAAS